MATLVTPSGHPNVAMLGIGAYRPSRVVTNDELCTVLDSSDQWIYERSGIRSRTLAGRENLDRRRLHRLGPEKGTQQDKGDSESAKKHGENCCRVSVGTKNSVRRKGSDRQGNNQPRGIRTACATDQSLWEEGSPVW